jgi:hypothetical protein
MQAEEGSESEDDDHPVKVRGKISLKNHYSNRVWDLYRRATQTQS